MDKDIYEALVIRGKVPPHYITVTPPGGKQKRGTRIEVKLPVLPQQPRFDPNPLDWLGSPEAQDSTKVLLTEQK